MENNEEVGVQADSVGHCVDAVPHVALTPLARYIIQEELPLRRD